MSLKENFSLLSSLGPLFILGIFFSLSPNPNKLHCGAQTLTVRFYHIH